MSILADVVRGVHTQLLAECEMEEEQRFFTAPCSNKCKGRATQR